MLSSIVSRLFQPKKFKLAQFYSQNNDFLIHQSHHKEGVCNGLVLEYARLCLTKKSGINIIKKFQEKATSASSNFAERVNSYQDFYPAISHKKYAASIDLAKLLRDEIKTSTVLAVCLEPVGSKKPGHLIAVKVVHHDFGEDYKIFDPNYGESIWYRSKLELVGAFDELKRKYSKNEYKGQKLQFSVVDLKVLLGDLGIVKSEGDYSKNSKYAYRFVDALKDLDLDEIHGDLGRDVKLDSYYTMNFDDASSGGKFTDLGLKAGSLMDLAISKLGEADLIKLININTQLDLNESLCSIIIFLAACEKMTSNVLDALIAKLPADNGKYLKLLEDLKVEIQQDPLKTHPLDDYKQEDKSLILAFYKSTSDEVVLDHFVRKQNEFHNKEIYYFVEEGDIVELHTARGADSGVDFSAG